MNSSLVLPHERTVILAQRRTGTLADVPNSAFTASTWTARVENALTYVFNGTKADDCIASDDWLEVNRCKYLFASGQAWTYETANSFALEAWRYVGFGS